MIKKCMTVVDVGDLQEVTQFYTWLAKNHKNVHGISDNDGCGCCVDIFYLLLDGDIPTFISEVPEQFQSKKILLGKDKEEILQLILGNDD